MSVCQYNPLKRYSILFNRSSQSAAVFKAQGYR